MTEQVHREVRDRPGGHGMAKTTAPDEPSRRQRHNTRRGNGPRHGHEPDASGGYGSTASSRRRRCANSPIVSERI